MPTFQLGAMRFTLGLLVLLGAAYATLAVASEQLVSIPVILLHGINNTPRHWHIFINTVDSVRQEMGIKGRLLAVHSPFDGVPGSWVALHEQVKWFHLHIKQLITLNPKEFEDGFDLVCHSQGAVICHALCQESDDRL